MGAPIMFTQERAGQYGLPFNLYKFRTMNNEVDSRGKLLPDDQRLTRMGKFIRKYSLDELPQLINVLKGEMSLVGPRPLLLEYNVLYSKEQKVRLQVKPGMTGWAQVNGRNALSWEKRFQLDKWYVENYTFRLDYKILLLTIIRVIQKEGITQPNHVSMEKFTSSKEVI